LKINLKKEDYVSFFCAWYFYFSYINPSSDTKKVFSKKLDYNKKSSIFEKYKNIKI